MAHHRDINVPHRLSAEAMEELERDPEMIDINSRIVVLTEKISKNPENHKDLTHERTHLYNKAAKRRQKALKEFVRSWWTSSYSEYIAGNDFTERDTTSLFDIYCKYMPERDRLRGDLFTDVPINSQTGRQCLQDLVNLCVSKERVAYYPGESPENGQCPICLTEMSKYVSFSTLILFGF